MVVVFGRPGAGKTTISSMAIKAFEDEKSNHNFLKLKGLDLDTCVPQWMKDNFSKGIYPTLKQRNEFADNCCEYVREQLGEAGEVGKPHASIISFSFVNTDLRDIFRSNFPEATWILIDTSEEEATQRIKYRQDHFYKGGASQTTDEAQACSEEQNDATKTQDNDNSDWKFAAVTFEHSILDGREAVEKNASKLIEIIKKLPVASA